MDKEDSEEEVDKVHETPTDKLVRRVLELVGSDQELHDATVELVKAHAFLVRERAAAMRVRRMRKDEGYRTRGIEGA